MLECSTACSSQATITIALLTPYSGRNLGDAAIQTAFIAHLRTICPPVKLIGLTEAPRHTEAIHHIPCFPLSVRSRPLTASNDSQVLCDSRPITGGRGLLRLLRSLAASVRIIRLCARVIRTGSELARALRREMTECVREWHLIGQVDLLLVAGGGQLDEEWGGAWAHPYALWRWTTLARARGRKVAFASVGMGLVTSKAAVWFIRHALSNAHYISCRDAGTLDRLASLGCPTHGSVIPDAALAVPIFDPLPPHRGDQQNVGIAPIIFGHTDHWPTPNGDVYHRYVDELATAVIYLLQHGHEVTLFVTNSADLVAVDDVLSSLGDISASPMLRVADTSTLPKLLCSMQALDVIVASRLHAVVLAHRLEKPVLAISFDRKVREQMKQSGHSDFCIDIDNVSRAQIIEMVAALRANTPTVVSRLREYVHGSQQSLDEQFRSLVRLATVRGTGSLSTEQSQSGSTSID